MSVYTCRGIVGMFPRSWRCDVTVKSSPGRDGRGNPMPTVEHTIRGALVGPRFSSENPGADTAQSGVALYHTTDLVISNTDRIIVPAGHRMAGEWCVSGRPSEWPLGTEVVLKTG